jgi:hypothetical protein
MGSPGRWLSPLLVLIAVLLVEASLGQDLPAAHQLATSSGVRPHVPGRGHLPLFQSGDTRGLDLGLFCGAVVLSWLYNRSGGSILLVAIWHATYAASGTDAATGLLAATSTTLVITLAVTLTGLEIRASHGGGTSVLAPTPRGVFPT